MNQILLKIPLPMRLIPEIDMMDIDALSGNEETSVDVEDLSDYFQNLSIDHETTTASFDVAGESKQLFSWFFRLSNSEESRRFGLESFLRALVRDA